MAPNESGPRCAVLAVVIAENSVLLVRRCKAPDAGLWGFPGGQVAFGEPLTDAATRELHEETSLTAQPLGVIDALDVLPADANAHYVLIGVAMTAPVGTARPSSDASEAAWFDHDGLPADRSAGVARVLSAATARFCFS